MKRAKTVDDYIASHPDWKDELDLLRSIAVDCGLPEVIKWGSPYYTVDGKNILGIGAFKSYVGLWFTQGVFLSDPANRLINAQEGSTKALRQWRFNSVAEMDANLIRSYVLEAIENQKHGKEVKPQRNASYEMPEELSEALHKTPDARSGFDALTPGKQKEYAAYIADAKRLETKRSRIEKVLPMMAAKLGLNDKYRS